MGIIQIITQTLAILFESLASLQKRKDVMMLLFSCVNIIMGIMYLTYNRYATFALCMVALIRTLIYAYYDYAKIKPKIYLLLCFEVFYILVTIIFWQDAFDLIPMFAILISTAGSWQSNMLIVRVGFVMNVSLYSIYNLMLGAYLLSAFNVIEIMCYITAIIYYNVLHKDKYLLDFLNNSKLKQKRN